MKLKSFLLPLLVLTILVIGIIPVAAAVSDLEFTADKVYFSDDNTLVVEGNFWHSSGSFISWIKADVEVMLLTEQGWQTVKESFTDMNVMLSPNSIRSWTFTVHNISKVPFSSWKVKTRFQ
jgi:hypothetical protein